MRTRDLRVVRGEERYAYSTGAIVEALQGAGVPTDDAISLARDVERRLRERNVRSVELPDLLAMLERGVQERVGAEAAGRFQRQTPPFVPIVVEVRLEDDKVVPEPFSRRTLTASLEKLGLGFKEAHVVALQVEQGIRSEGLERLLENDLARRVALVLEGRYGRDLRLRYEALTSRSFEIRVRDENGASFPYSRGILAQSLMTVGLGPELSHNLAKRVEEALYALNVAVVAPERVRDEVVRLLQREAGEEFARRYRIMRDARRPDKPIVVLLGGAPGVGKSAVASELGYRLGIPRIVSTDSVRQALRSLISPELSPLLHASSYTAWRAEMLPSELETARPKRKRVLRGYLAQVQQLRPAVVAIIERNIDEATSLVMEGAHLVPGASPGRDFRDATVVPLVLAVADEDDHRRHFGVREGQTGNRRGAKTYIEHFSEIRLLQEYLAEQAGLEGVPVIEASDFDRAVERCVDHVLDVLLMERVQDGAKAAEAPGPAAVRAAS